MDPMEPDRILGKREGYTYVDGHGHRDPDLLFCEYISGEAKAEAGAVARSLE